MVTDMMNRWKAEFARALRNFRYEKSPEGIVFPAQNVRFGGIFETMQADGPWVPAKNTVTLEGLDKLLTDWFNSGSSPTGFYLAPFTNNTTPASSLKASNFSTTLGEYTGYTQANRVQWVSNGPSASQTVSNSNAPAEFTVGASAVNVNGAALLTTATKSGVTGVCVAAAKFDVPNSLNAGSTLKIKYSLSGAPAA